MINLKTILILGAGASKPFGFPTGRGLVHRITMSFRDSMRGSYKNLANIAGEEMADRALKFASALKLADPPSVDVWLEENSDYIDVGKIAIAMILLGCENSSELRPENNWYRLLFDRIHSAFDEFQDNKLAIVTFNYDRSLEQYLFERFMNTYTGEEEEKRIEKLNQLEIFHIYGCLGRLPWQFDDPENPIPEVPYRAGWKNSAIKAADSIDIMCENSDLVSKRFQKFKELMKDCQAVYFLGFGYHQVNMQRLGIDTISIPKVMGTARGLSYQRIKEIEGFNIGQLFMDMGLFRTSIYNFLHKWVHFNDRNCSDRCFYGDSDRD